MVGVINVSGSGAITASLNVHNWIALLITASNPWQSIARAGGGPLKLRTDAKQCKKNAKNVARCWPKVAGGGTDFVM